jgi:hypothetical protein
MPLLKILISIIAIGITIVEIWEFRKKKKNKNWGKLKKPIIIFSSLLLLLLTVWDEINDDQDNRVEETRRNAQIVKDSIRASNIITDLKTALDKIDSTAIEINKSSKSLSKVDSSISLVNDGLSIQGNRLSEIISESEEVNKNLIGGDSYIKLFLVKRWRTQTLELLVTVMGKYPMHNISLYITCSSFQDSILEKPIKLEPLINGSGINMAFDVRFSSLTTNISTYSIAKFDVNDFKRHIRIGVWSYSNNGSTLQIIDWKNHKKYFSAPRETGSATLTDNIDYSGKSFEYSSRISRVTPVVKEKIGDNIIDSTAGIAYYDNYMVQFNLFEKFLLN